MPRDLVDSMVCLVGSNPLPILYGIRQYVQPGGVVVLIHSGDTADAARRIKVLLGRSVKVNLEYVRDPFSPRSVMEVAKRVADEHPRSTLNYTGGTKVMSAGAFLVWGSKRYPLVYLEDRSGAFHWDITDEEEALTATATIEEILSVHGWEMVPTVAGPSVTRQDLRTRFDAQRQHLNFIKDVTREEPDEQFKMLQDGYETHWRDSLQRLIPDSWEQWLSQGPLPRPEDYFRGGGLLPSTSTLYDQLFFLDGSYLEATVANAVLDCGADEVLKSVFAKRQGTSAVAEIDVLARVGRRLHLISVTSSGYVKVAKQKSFEARQRASQLGGDLAGFAVASMIREDQRNLLERTVDHAGFKAFAKADLRRWMDGQTRDLSTFLQVH